MIKGRAAQQVPSNEVGIVVKIYSRNYLSNTNHLNWSLAQIGRIVTSRTISVMISS